MSEYYSLQEKYAQKQAGTPKVVRVFVIMLLSLTLTFSLCFSGGIGVEEAWGATGKLSVASTSLKTMATKSGKLKLNKTKANMTAGKTLTLKVAKAGKKKVKWTSSNKKVAKVNKNGKVSAIKKGKATITAKVNGKKLTCKVNVNKDALTVSNTNVRLSPEAYETMPNFFTVDDGYGEASVNVSFTKCKTNTMRWACSDSSVVKPTWGSTWSGNSVQLFLEGLKPGTATIKLTNDFNNEVKTIKVTVSRALPIEIEPDYQFEEEYLGYDYDSGSYVSAWWLPIYITNYSNSWVTITDESVSYYPYADYLDYGERELVLFDFDKTDVISASNPVLVAPGGMEIVYALAYVGDGQYDYDVSDECALLSSFSLGHDDYAAFSDYYGAITSWLVS